MKRILPLVLVLMAAFSALAPGGPKPKITSATTASGTVGVAFTYQIEATNNPTSYNAAPLPTGLSVNTTSGLISGTPTTAGTFSVGLSATNANGTGTATLTLTINPPPPNFLRVQYNWSAQSSTSYLGSATTFLGTVISGQTILPSGGDLPPVSDGLYLTNNTPAVGSASIDVLVGTALQDGKWTGSVPVTCAADWSSQYAPGTTATLTVTLFDSTQTILQTETKTITPGLNNAPPVPSTIVATITYNSDGTFTMP
jgi:hypothetical protein